MPSTRTKDLHRSDDAKDRVTPADKYRQYNAKETLIRRWWTPEFYLYYLISAFAYYYLITSTLNLSSEEHDGFFRMEWYLSPGWMTKYIDNSDGQYRHFRANIPILTVVLVGHALLSRATLNAPALRQSALLCFTLLFLAVLHGTSLLIIFAFLSLHYFLSTSSLARKVPKINIALAWVFCMAMLIANEKCDGYRFSSIGMPFLDQYRGILSRWHVSFNICMLRMLSFTYDVTWSQRPPQHTIPHDESACRDCQATRMFCEKGRVELPMAPEEYAFKHYLLYCLYAPLYLAGPVLTFNDFGKQARSTIPTVSWSTVGKYAARLVACFLLYEWLLHHFFVVAATKAKIWESMTPLQVVAMGYWNLNMIWLKLLIMWRFFRCMSMLAGIDPPENMTRCMTNNPSAAGFWRDWHRSFNLWLIRYVYIPLGGKYTQQWNMPLIFTFVAIWHDLSLSLLAWGWVISLFILPELLLGRWWRKYADRPFYRHVCAFGAVGNIFMMVIGNLIGFCLGVDGIWAVLPKLFTIQGVTTMLGTLVSLFALANIMYECDKRKVQSAME